METRGYLPIVLPPTVIGFYLLVLFAPHNPSGQLWIALTAHTLAFSFSGLLGGLDHLQSAICRATCFRPLSRRFHIR